MTTKHRRISRHPATSRQERRLSRGQAIGGVVSLFALTAAMSWFGFSGSPSVGAHPNLFAGSLVLAEERPPIVVDLATGLGTIRLAAVFSDVGATSYSQVQPVAVSGGTFLVNTTTGSFNYLDADDLVVKPTGGGVALGAFPGSTSAAGFADGDGAYIVRYDASSATISLVDRNTVVAGTDQRNNASVLLSGFAKTNHPIGEAPGAVAVSGDGLFALEGTGRSRTIDEYRSTGRGGLLQAVSHGDVSSLSALEAFGSKSPAPYATQNAVALASPTRIELFESGRNSTTRLRTVVLHNLGAVDQIVPTSSATGQAWFLFHTPSSWFVAGVGLNGSTVGPSRIDPSKLSPAAALVEPAYSNGELYTLTSGGSSGGRLLTIDPNTGHVSGIAGLPDYPLKSKAEAPVYAETLVISEGPRVVYDNPDALLAAVVFSDGSRRPAIVDGNTLAAVDPAAPPGALATLSQTKRSRNQTPIQQQTDEASHAKQIPVQQVNDQLDCAKTEQKPHAPDLVPPATSPRSVTVSWHYPLFDSEDCEPSSYLVTVTETDGTPLPASPYEVTGGTSLTITGLNPSTTYRIVVSALIGNQSTNSISELATTSATGPGAPTSVSTTFQAGSGWEVSWTPCRGALCGVPPASWSVTGASCGSGFLSNPPSLSVSGSATSALIPMTSSLVGYSLTFSVAATGTHGESGDPSSDGSCTEGWQPPNAATIGVSAGGATDRTTNTMTANLQVTTSGPSNAAFGTLAPTFQYQVWAGANCTGSSIASSGPTANATTQIAHLPLGEQLWASVIVTSSDHPSATATVCANGPISQSEDWPKITFTVSSSSVSSTNPDSGVLQGSFATSSAGPPPVINITSATISCANTTDPVTPSPANSIAMGSLVSLPLADLVNEGSACVLSFNISDAESPSDYAGHSPPVLTSALSVPTNADTTAPSFAAAFVNPTPSQSDDITGITISATNFDGRGQWTASIGGLATLCPRNQPPATSAQTSGTLTVDLSGCIAAAVAAATSLDSAQTFQPTINVRWTYLGTTVLIPGTAPSAAITSVSAPTISSRGAIFQTGTAGTASIGVSPATGNGVNVTLSASGLPGGASLSPAGLLTVPSTAAAGNYMATLTATETLNGTSSSTSISYSIAVVTVNPNLTVTDGTSLSALPIATAGAVGLIFSLDPTSGPLPAGVNISSDGESLTGTASPTNGPGAVHLVFDANVGTVSGLVATNLRIQSALEINLSTLPSSGDVSDYSAVQLIVTGGNGSYTWTLAGEGNPDPTDTTRWFSLSTAGVLSMAAGAPPGVYSLNFAVVDTSTPTNSSSQAATLTITP